MTYKELYESAINKFEKGKITLDEFEKMIEPLNAEVSCDSDTISRIKAIDIAKELTITVDGYEMLNQAVMNYCAEIMQLPPAEPMRIIHCKDCKHHWTHKCMDSMPIERCDLGQTFYNAEVDYCSLAKRREVTE